MKRNRIKLYTEIGGELVSHFMLAEAETPDGFAMVHPSTLRSLELTRMQLNKQFPLDPVYIVITCWIRTETHNADLAVIYGWTDEGGTVARNSKHLPKYQGIAVDFVARHKSGARVEQSVAGKAARMFFDWVKDDYAEGHVHADNRNHL